MLVQLSPISYFNSLWRQSILSRLTYNPFEHGAAAALSPQATTSCAYKPTVVLTPQVHLCHVCGSERQIFNLIFPRTLFTVAASLWKFRVHGPCCHAYFVYFSFFFLFLAYTFTQQLQFCVALEVSAYAAATLFASLVWTDLAVGYTACHLSAWVDYAAVVCVTGIPIYEGLIFCNHFRYCVTFLICDVNGVS